MIESMASFAGMCLFLYVTIHAWTHGDSIWCIFFIIATLVFGCLFVDHTLYGGEGFNTLAEWLAMKADTYDQAQ